VVDVLDGVEQGDTRVRIRLIGYWATTAVAAFTLLAAGLLAFVPGGPLAKNLAHLGYPAYLVMILGVWKLLGGIALLVPRFPRLKEWAYAGTFFDYTGALASGLYLGRDDPGTFIWLPLILVGITLASWALRPPSRRLSGRLPSASTRDASVEPAPAPVSARDTR
jgi:uncharacterized membrane protein YphA (DoxX/SURF4 family)